MAQHGSLEKQLGQASSRAATPLEAAPTEQDPPCGAASTSAHGFDSPNYSAQLRRLERKIDWLVDRSARRSTSPLHRVRC